MTLSPIAATAVDAAEFQTDMAGLRRLADEILATTPPTPGRLPVMPPPLDPMAKLTVHTYRKRWPHDDAADLIAAWHIHSGKA